MFLVDANLVLLQPSTNDEGEPKYDMRIIATKVEYFGLTRDQPVLLDSLQQPTAGSPSSESLDVNSHMGRGLEDSLWYFDGDQVHCWINVERILPAGLTNDGVPAQTVSMPTDFYPCSIMLGKGIILGMDADLIQHRDVPFAFFQIGVRVSTLGEVTRTPLT